MLATHKPVKTTLGKVVVHLLPGQFVSGRKALAKIVGVSEQTMRTIIAFFEQEKMITKSSNRNGTVFSVLNFGTFQTQKINQHATNINNPPINQPEVMNTEASSDIATNVSTNTQPSKSTTKQENNNKPKDIKDMSTKRISKPQSFKDFFTAYPIHRKGGSDSSAWKAWKSEKLTADDALLAIDWLIKSASQNPDWLPAANGQFVYGITKFIRERIWLTPAQPGKRNTQLANDINWDDKSWADDLQGGLI